MSVLCILLDFSRWNGFLCIFRRFSILFSFFFYSLFLLVFASWIQYIISFVFVDAYCPGDCRFCWNATFKYETHTASISQLYISAKPHTYIYTIIPTILEARKIVPFSFCCTHTYSVLGDITSNLFELNFGQCLWCFVPFDFILTWLINCLNCFHYNRDTRSTACAWFTSRRVSKLHIQHWETALYLLVIPASCKVLCGFESIWMLLFQK